MKVERVEVLQNRVTCWGVVSGIDRFFVTARVERHRARLVVTMISLDVDPFVIRSHSEAESVEVTREMLRRLDPSAVVRGLYDFVEINDVDPRRQDLRHFLFEHRDPQIRKAHEVVSEAVEPPRRRGRRPKFDEAELVEWTRTAMALDAQEPPSLRAALAQAMSASGRPDLAHSTQENARDLLSALRQHGLLQRPRTPGARERLIPTDKFLKLESDR